LAYLTKVMGASARTSAEQSRIAAEASLASVAVAEASVDVQFDLRPEKLVPRQFNAGPELVRELESLGMIEASRPDGPYTVPVEYLELQLGWRTVVLTCRGATVSVHGLRVTLVGTQPKEGAKGSKKTWDLPNRGELAPTEKCRAPGLKPGDSGAPGSS
jgi:hypothetical protein